MTSLCHFLLALLPAVVVAEDFHVRYFTDITMECDERKHNISTSSAIARKYWLFPEGQMYAASTNSTGRLEFDAANSTLTIRKIDDDDFGKYYCIVVHNDNTVSHIGYGLNVHGAYFGDLLEKYKRKAITGGIAAGCLFAVVGSVCIFWQFRYQKRNQRNKVVDELDKAIDGYDLKAYDNVAIDTDTPLREDGKADGVTDLEQKL